jgi:hypothetical protein
MAGLCYQRVHPRDEPREPRKFEPLSGTHPLVGSDFCPGCLQRFAAGDVTTLVAIGPGNDEAEREKLRTGRVYNAVAVAAHYACVTGEEAS